jgi:predicted nucleotidyltransferase
MGRDEAVAKLSELAGRLRSRGVTSLYLYGSTARGEAEAGSDIDLFVDYDPASRFSLFDLMDVRNEIEAALGTKADVTTRAGLHPAIRGDVIADSVRII